MVVAGESEKSCCWAAIMRVVGAKEERLVERDGREARKMVYIEVDYR